jgi:hypothetical protein
MKLYETCGSIVNSNSKKAVVFVAAVCLLAIFTRSISAAEPPLSAAEELQSQTSKPLPSASATRIEKALATVIKKNPAKAAAYLEALLMAGRKESCPEVAGFVGVAIQSLGENPPQELVMAIILQAVALVPAKCAPMIVGAAVKAAPAALAATIVERTIAALANPGQLVDGNITLAQAIVNAALVARPGLDAVALGRAADRGFASNLASQFASAISNQGKGAASQFSDSPNRAVVVAPREVEASR